jgi:hypothetical protein
MYINFHFIISIYKVLQLDVYTLVTLHITGCSYAIYCMIFWLLEVILIIGNVPYLISFAKRRVAFIMIINVFIVEFIKWYRSISIL